MLMFAPFLEAFLTGNTRVRTTGIVGTCRADHSRIISPRMHEDILRGNDVATTVRSDVGVMKKLDTSVDGLTTNKRNTESSDIFEGAAESVFGKKSEQFDSSGRVNFANSVPVESPDLVSFRDPPIQTHNITDSGTGGVATRIADKDGIWRAGPSDIIMAATHANDKDFNAKLEYRKYINDLYLETIQMLERDKRARENIENNLT